MTTRLDTYLRLCAILTLVSCANATAVENDETGAGSDAVRRHDQVENDVAGDPLSDLGDTAPTDGEMLDLADQAAADTRETDPIIDVPPADVAEGDDPSLDLPEEVELDATSDTPADPVVDLEVDQPMDTEGCTVLPSSGSRVLGGEVAGDSPTWDLPNTADCSVDVGGASLARYSWLEVCNTGPTAQFDFLAEGGRDDPTLTLGGVAIFLYEGGGFPGDPTGCAAQAENVGGDGLIDNFEIGASSRVTLVASSFSEVISGTFRLTASAAD